VLAGSTRMAVAALAAWLSLAAIGGLRELGVHVPLGLGVACVVFAGPVALVATLRTIAAAWLGPPVVAFSREEAALCRPAEAIAIRAAAQLCGTMGGAGHLHRSRLVFPAAAWVAALATAVEAVGAPGLDAAGPWPLVVAAVSPVAAWMFPSRPYWYCEVTGGGVLVSPPGVAAVMASRCVDDRAEPRAAEPGTEA